ncbi:MAG: SMP-30/gluconolactonase/LRE family protein [Lautropia sp.]
MYAAPSLIETEVFSRMPPALHRTGRHSAWAEKRGSGPLHSFLEGPAFDRDGHLYCTDIPHGRIFRIDPQGGWQTFAEFDGEPNGLKIHRDGRLFVADHKRGLLSFAPDTGVMTTVLDRAHLEGFKGLNDLVFGANGDLFFTDQGQSALQDPTGRVYRLRSTGELDLLYAGLAGPNGLVLNREEDVLHVAVTRANQIVSIPLLPGYAGVGRCRVFIQLSGGPTGPDGMALDEEGNLAVVHAGFGTVWVFSRYGEPVFRIRSCAGMRTTNVAFGGPDNRTLFITEADQGAVLTARLPHRGKPMYSHT